jgi:Skp family chaperone for outer membrane proteins
MVSRGCLGWGLVLWLMAAVPLAAQDAPIATDPIRFSPVLTLDQDRLFAESAFGRASLERDRAAAGELEAENGRIEAELIAEEQDLTARRAELPPEEFSALAAAFDEKVERIRSEQDSKARDLGRARDEDRQAFLRAIVPVLGEVMREQGAVAILDKSTVILSLTVIDITDEAIAKVDAVLAQSAPATP